ncbi:MAG: Hsp20/alpha crystallin family protein [Gammaproteobacteria bacterium]
MNIVRRNNSPLSTFRPQGMDDPFGRLVESMFEDMFQPFGMGQAGAMAPWQAGAAPARLNVTEHDNYFEIEVEMPGVQKEDVKVMVEQQRVTIEGEARREHQQREGETVVYSERSSGKFMRSFMLPSNVDEANAQARMENGILKLTLPKRAEHAGTRLTIQ